MNRIPATMVLSFIICFFLGQRLATSVEKNSKKVLEGENLKTNPLFQVPNNCILQKPTAVRSESHDSTVIFTYTKTCKEGDADITEHLFAVCGEYYPYGQNEYSKIQCQTSGWIQLK